MADLALESKKEIIQRLKQPIPVWDLKFQGWSWLLSPLCSEVSLFVLGLRCVSYN